jgi:hypothetical protein
MKPVLGPEFRGDFSGFSTGRNSAKAMAAALALLVGASASSCARKETGAGTHEPAGPYVTKFRIGHAVASDATVTIEGDSFAPGDPIYVSFEVRKVPPKSPVKVVWSGPSKTEISQEQKPIASGTGAVSFELKDTAGLAAGDYLVEFFCQDSGAPEKWLSLGHKPFRIGRKQPS